MGKSGPMKRVVGVVKYNPKTAEVFLEDPKSKGSQDNQYDNVFFNLIS